MGPSVTFDDVRAAEARIRGLVRRTPVLTSSVLDERAGARLFFKCENFQKAGVFKARGAHNAVFALSEDEAAAGVLTHSSGNHGAALSLAARRRGIPAHIVVPEGASAAKVEAIRRYGGQVTFSPATLPGREAAAARIRGETGARLVHPYDDPLIIAGQGTAALELLAEVPGLEAVVAPVGGGGLLSGTALAAKGLDPRLRVFGAEPAGADDAARSLAAGRFIPQENPRTIADGLRTSLGQLTFPILRERLEGVLTVPEDEIVEAMRLAWQVMKIVIEPSSAVPLAALLGSGSPLRGRRVGVILSGGNVDLDRLPWIKA
ncbi:MAG TPA: pyridoxal-phosphate dependent enzyme [Opitutaceae bacterium]|nr:pyridoxal-phosphate dependent enzyme [Opitutaceae bacterium]